MRILRVNEVADRMGIGRTSLHIAVHAGTLTRPISVTGGRNIGWPEHEINAVIAARIAGKSNADIRALVSKLHIERQRADAGTIRETAPAVAPKVMQLVGGAA